MDFYNDEFLKLIAAFERQQFQYLVVGGFAVNIHGYHRTTGDVDIWIKDSHENRTKLINALESIGYGKLESLLSTPLVPGFCEVMMDNGVYLDIMDRIIAFDQKDFDSCYLHSKIESLSGHSIRFLNYNDLLKSKSNSSRLKDQLDVEQLIDKNKTQK